MAIIINKDNLPPKEQKKSDPKRNKDTRSVEEIRAQRRIEQGLKKSEDPVIHHYSPVTNEIFDIRPKKSDTLNYVKAEPREHHDSSHEVIINGQAKKIGKHSHYLLDMITNED